MALPLLGEDSAKTKSIKLGVIGVGGRGSGLLSRILEQDQGVEIPAICDIDEKHLSRACDAVEKSRGKRPKGFSKDEHDYRRLLDRGDINAVLIVTPHEWHAPMTIDAMKAGKFVGSEVPACCTIDECWQLVKTSRETKSGYML